MISENKNETLSTIKSVNTVTKTVSESWLIDFVIKTAKPVEKKMQNILNVLKRHYNLLSI